MTKYSFVILFLVTFFSRVVHAHQAECLLELSDSKRAGVLLSAFSEEIKINAVEDLLALAAYLERPVALSDMRLAPSAVELKSLRRSAYEIDAVLKRLEDNLFILKSVLRPGDSIEIEEFYLAPSSSTRARLFSFASKIRISLKSERLQRAAQAYGEERIQLKDYLMELEQILGAQFKTHGSEVQMMMQSLVTRG